jgi:hypothetical protein
MKKKYQEKEELLRAYNRLSTVTKKEFKQLILLSRDRSPVIRFEVAEILFCVKNNASKKVLLKLACDKDELVRTEAYDSLSGFPLPEIGLFLKKAIQTEKDGLACSYAISSWVEIALSLFEEHSEDIVFIKELLKLNKIKKSEHCLLQCYYSLYRFGEPGMLDKMLEFLQSKDYNMHFCVYDVLEDVVNDENRSMIIDALGNMLMEEESAGVRKTVIPFWKQLIIDQTLKTMKSGSPEG